jgi:8-oxo-dGTP diphosphatase
MGKGFFRYCPVCRAELEQRTLEGRRRDLCPQCDWTCYENPLPSAAALVKNRSGEILLVRRGIEPGKGQWALPSGFIEIDETPEQACLRELEEETGLRGEIKRLIGVYSQPSLMYKNVLIIGYEVTARGEPCPGSDSVEAGFYTPDRLPEIAFPSHSRIIRDGTEA